MKLSIETTKIEKEVKANLIIGIFEDGTLTASAKALDELNRGYLSQFLRQGCFQGKVAETLPLFNLPHGDFSSVLLVGCGKNKSLSPSVFRKIVACSMKACSLLKAKEVVSYLSDLHVENRSLPWKIKHICEASFEGLYRFDQFKSEKEPAISIKNLVIHLPAQYDKKDCEEALKQGIAIADAVSYTKNLANLPSNICTPDFLAQSAKELAKSYSSLAVEILDEEKMRKLGMGALLAVAQGSAQDARLICFEYKGASKNKAPIALVGKGITFDTGGNSLKPADGMVGMKYDMCGGATVFGAIKAAAELKLPINVVGVVAAVENMPGGTAYKPEDILTSMSGQTIEVISTDAEGRLVLADALTYCERYKPDVVIDVATLTGAVVIALGLYPSGMMSNDATLAKDLQAAADQSADRIWELPLWEDYQELIKSPFADMANVGGRPAGSITAGCFLSRFAKKFRWAHLDVAGTAAIMFGNNERLATGRPVPLLMQYLLNRIEK